MESRFVGTLILGVLRGVAWAYYLQPAFLRKFWGAGLGRVLSALRLRSGVVDQNLALAFPKDPEKRATVFRAAYEHLGMLSLEILMLLGPMRRFVLRGGEVRGVENWRKAKEKGNGVIFLASHVGNWEVMAASGALKHGIDILLVTKHLKPEWLHRAIERGRLSCGVRATYEPRTLKDVLGHLKRNGTVGFVLDQYAGPPVGVRIPVFGVPVGTSTVVAMLAKRTGATVLPVVNYRQGSRFIIEIRPAASWQTYEDSSFELAVNTAAYSSHLEKDIFEHPEQWLWTHRRFKGDLTPLRDREWNEGRSPRPRR